MVFWCNFWGVDGCWDGVKSAFCALFCHFFIKKQKNGGFLRGCRFFAVAVGFV